MIERKRSSAAAAERMSVELTPEQQAAAARPTFRAFARADEAIAPFARRAGTATRRCRAS